MSASQYETYDPRQRFGWGFHIWKGIGSELRASRELIWRLVLRDVSAKYRPSMFARIGFPVAAHCDTDVLLVDEVLSVGDHKFQNRCVQWTRAF